jgi:LysR family nod box-dependent transcriptional activator
MASMDHGPRTLAGVDLNLLKALDALLQERSVTRSAQRLGLTQPSVSSALGRLRALFDDDLLVRAGRDMRPTPFAQTLAPTVRRLVAQIEDLVIPRSTFDPHRDAQSFTVMATDYAAVILLQPVMQALAVEAPNIRIQLRSTDLADHATALQRGEIDLAIVPLRFSATNTLPREVLFRDRFVAAVWEGNDRVSGQLTYEQLDGLPYLTYRIGPVASMVDTLLEELGHPREADTVVPSFLLGPFLLRGTPQVTFLQARLAHRLKRAAGLKLIAPPFPSPTLVETMTWHPRSTHQPAHVWLRTRIIALARELETQADRAP